MVIDCALSTRSVLSKVVWLVVMILIFPFMALVYGVVACKKRLARWLSAIGLLSIGLLLGVGMWGLWTIGDLMLTYVTDVEKLLANVRYQDVSEDEKEHIKTVLDEMKTDARLPMLEQLKKRRSLKVKTSLLGLLEVYTDDGVLDAEEYKKWAQKYEERDVLDPDAFEEYVRKKKRQGFGDPALK